MFRHTTKNTKNVATHTRIGDKDLNVYSGSFHIPEEELNEFYKLYKNYIRTGNKEYLTEKQLLENGQMVVDLDFRYEPHIQSRQHTEDLFLELINGYLQEFKSYFLFDEFTSFNVYVMEKPNVNMLPDKTKDGIHFVFGLSVPYDIQLEIRQHMIQKCKDGMFDINLPLINSFEDVFDVGLSKGSTNWMLYGSQKPGNEAYEVVESYEIGFDTQDKEFTMNHIEFDFETDFANLSAQHRATCFPLNPMYNKNETYGLKPLFIVNPSPSPISVAEIDLSECHTDISKLLNIIGDSRCGEGKYNEWVAVGQVLKNEFKDDGLDHFVNWTFQFGTENKKKEATNKFQKHIKYNNKKDSNRLSIASLHYWAKQQNIEAYHKAFPKTNNEQIEYDSIFDFLHPCLSGQTESDLAKAFNEIYKGQYICTDTEAKKYFCFNDITRLWGFDKGGSPIRLQFSAGFVDYFEKYRKYFESKQQSFEPHSKQYEECSKALKAIAEIVINLKKTQQKNGLLKELSDIIKNVDFEKSLNKSLYLLPTSDDKVLDLKTLSLYDRTIEHKFSFQCNAKYIQYEENNENFQKVDKYFNDLFCNNQETKQLVLNIFKSVFTGNVMRYIYFCIGTGRNGKSLLFKILNKIFGKFMDIISENVIIEQRGNKSSLNTEIEKLDKCRLGYVTELKEDDKLNEKVIKQITGGDSIDLRTLQETNKTINPTCNLFVLTNSIPKFNAEDKAVIDRFVAIPFKAIFEVNTQFETEMLALSDYIFTYIMIKGHIIENVVQTTEMKDECKIHIDNNKDSSLEDFLNDKLVDCINDANNKPIILNDLRLLFENYCQINKIKNVLTQKKFTTKIKSLKLDIRESNGKTRLYSKKLNLEDDNAE